MRGQWHRERRVRRDTEDSDAGTKTKRNVLARREIRGSGDGHREEGAGERRGGRTEVTATQSQ